MHRDESWWHVTDDVSARQCGADVVAGLHNGGFEQIECLPAGAGADRDVINMTRSLTRWWGVGFVAPDRSDELGREAPPLWTGPVRGAASTALHVRSLRGV